MGRGRRGCGHTRQSQGSSVRAVRSLPCQPPQPPSRRTHPPTATGFVKRPHGHRTVQGYGALCSGLRPAAHATYTFISNPPGSRVRNSSAMLMRFYFLHHLTQNRVSGSRNKVTEHSETPFSSHWRYLFLIREITVTNRGKNASV